MANTKTYRSVGKVDLMWKTSVAVSMVGLLLCTSRLVAQSVIVAGTPVSNPWDTSTPTKTTLVGGFDFNAALGVSGGCAAFVVPNASTDNFWSSWFMVVHYQYDQLSIEGGQPAAGTLSASVPSTSGVNVSYGGDALPACFHGAYNRLFNPTNGSIDLTMTNGEYRAGSVSGWVDAYGMADLPSIMAYWVHVDTDILAEVGLQGFFIYLYGSVSGYTLDQRDYCRPFPQWLVATATARLQTSGTFNPQNPAAKGVLSTLAGAVGITTSAPLASGHQNYAGHRPTGLSFENVSTGQSLRMGFPFQSVQGYRITATDGTLFTAITNFRVHLAGSPGYWFHR